MAALGVTLTANEQERLWRRNTDNLDAYDFFLRGLAYAFRFTKETNGQAQQMYERALELDPAYADAYAALGATHLATVIFQWSQAPQTLERAYELAQKALALNDSLALPHLLLGQVYLWRDRQHEQAIAAVEKALTLNPNLAAAYDTLAEMLNFAGRPEEALRMIETAMSLNPHYPFHYTLTLGWAYLEARRYDEAITAYKRTLALNPDLLYAHLDLAIIYSVLGQEAQAREEVAELLRLNPDFSLEVWKQTMPVKDPAALAHWVAVLRKAGLK